MANAILRPAVLLLQIAIVNSVLAEATVRSSNKRKSNVLHEELLFDYREGTQGITKRMKIDGREEDDDEPIWRWWEEERYANGIKWMSLEHNGPLFAPPYEKLPSSVHFFYDGKVVKLSEATEEVATFYAKMLDENFVQMDIFNNNFFDDWQKVMTPLEKRTIKYLHKCNFTEINNYYKLKANERKHMTPEERRALNIRNEELVQQYGYCVIDGHIEKIGNFRVEPPGIFRGRGNHPKMGMLKKRVMPEDIIINCSNNKNIPKPPPGHRWKEVRHDNTVTWLACWNENIQGQIKYIMLNESSKLKGEKDWQKYELARKLKRFIFNIREQYERDWTSTDMAVRQRAVALYFIDMLSLRAGNEKDEGETADTVGCCSLRVEHIKLVQRIGDRSYVVEFDFLGKDSIRYTNSVTVDRRVFNNLQLFIANKKSNDELFDRLNTNILNRHLNDLMVNLTARVFRTYNASKTLQEQLELLTKPEDSIHDKILAYNQANRSVAILCNHQRAVPKTFEKSMENLQNKIRDKKDKILECRSECLRLKSKAEMTLLTKDQELFERKRSHLASIEQQLAKLQSQAKEKEENKNITLTTSKVNYLDPRITVAWCKKWNVPITAIYSKTQQAKFRWAIEVTGPEFKF